MPFPLPRTFFLQMSPFLQLQSQLPACLPPLGPQLSTCHVTFLFVLHSSITLAMYVTCMLQCYKLGVLSES